MRGGRTGRFGAIIAAAVVAFCTDGVEPCACEPSRTHILVYGATKDDAGAPVAGATVFVVVPRLGAQINDPIMSPEHATATTGSDGNYRIDLVSVEPPSNLPVGVTAAAVRAPGDTVRLAGFGGVSRPLGQRPDSVQITFVFP